MPSLAYLVPSALTMLAVAVLWFGLPRAHRYRQPIRWRLGVSMAAAGLVTLWLLPALVLAFVTTTAYLKAILLLLAVACGASLLGGGLQAMSKADYTAAQDHWDGILR